MDTMLIQQVGYTVSAMQGPKELPIFWSRFLVELWYGVPQIDVRMTPVLMQGPTVPKFRACRANPTQASSWRPRLVGS